MTDEDIRGRAFQRAQAVKSYIQGEVLDVADACVVLADPAWPLSDRAVEAADDQNGAGIIVVPEPVDLVVLLTQTCDLQETSDEARLCQVAPVVDRGMTFAHEAQRGRRPGWAALPWHSDGGVADLANHQCRAQSPGRSVVARSPSDSPRTAAFRRNRRPSFHRVALPDPVCLVLAPFLKRIKDKHDRSSDEGRCIAMIANLRIEATPDFDDADPALRLLVILEAPDLPPAPDDMGLDQGRIDGLVASGNAKVAKEALEATDPISRREAWTALAELWTAEARKLVETTAGVASLDVEVLSGDEMSFTRLRNAPELDLAYLSSRAA